MLDRAEFNAAYALSHDPFDEFTEDELELLRSSFGPPFDDGTGGFSVETVPYPEMDFPRGNASAEDCAANEQEAGILHRAVMMLPPRQSQVVVLRFGLSRLGEHTQQEVADLLGVSQPAVAKHEKKAVENLRKILEAMPEGLEVIASRMIEMGKSGRA